jgi:hypothetical protein
VDHRPGAQFLNGLEQAGFPQPQFVELQGEPRRLAIGLQGKKLGSLRPWARGPDSLELLRPLFPQVIAGPNVPEHWFNHRIVELYSKAWSAEQLRAWLRDSDRDREMSTSKLPAQARLRSFLCTLDEVGVATDSAAETLKAIERIRNSGHHKVVVKEAIGLAGHNAIRLWEPQLLETQRRWIERAIEQGRQLVVEPWLEREADFSVQLEMGPSGLRLLGYTGLVNDHRGQYQGNWVLAGAEKCLPEPVTKLFSSAPGIAEQLHYTYEELCSRLEVGLRQTRYEGPVGIDALVFRTSRGEPRLKPIVEVNPRYTMGRLTLELMRRVYPGSYGVFRLISQAMARAAGYPDLRLFAAALGERSPVQLAREPQCRIQRGVLCLNDPERAQGCVALLHAGETPASASLPH